MSLDDWWYAVCSYDAPSEEQLSIVVGETVQLIDDSDSEWWYAMCPRTEQSGYIPALFIEVRSSAWCLRPSLIDIDEPRPSTAMATHSPRMRASLASTPSRTARFGAPLPPSPPPPVFVSALVN